MNHRRHLVLIIVSALILVTSTALPTGHFFYSASNQPHSVQTDRAVIFDNFLPIPDDRDPVIETRFCLNSDHYHSFIFLNLDKTGKFSINTGKLKRAIRYGFIQS
jgi:hypothetical protein